MDSGNQGPAAPIAVTIVEKASALIPKGPEPHQKMVTLNDGMRASEKQVRESYDHFVKVGKMTKEEANARLKAEHGLEGSAPPPAANTFESLYDQNFSAPEKPSEYYLPTLKEDGTKETSARNNLVRSTLQTAGFQKEFGESFVKLSDETAKTLSRLSPEQQREWPNQQKKHLQAIWGDKTEAKLAAVNQFINDLEIKSPGSGKMIRSTDSVFSAQSILMISNHIERLAIRGKK